MAKKDKNLEAAKNTGLSALGVLIGSIGAEYLGKAAGDMVPELQTTVAQAGVKAVGAVIIAISSIKMKNKVIPLSIAAGVGASSAKDLVASYLPADSVVLQYLPTTGGSGGVGRLLHLDYSLHRGRGGATQTKIRQSQGRVKVY